MTSLRWYVDTAQRQLDAVGVDSPRADAEILAASVLGITRGEMAAKMMLGTDAPDSFGTAYEALVDRRVRREPLQHLVGSAPFRGLDIVVRPGVFIPRPETEVVAGVVIAEAQRRVGAGLNVDGMVLVVDLCAGSGAIGIAVAHEVPQARVVSLEVSDDAAVVAAANIATLVPDGRVRLVVESVTHLWALADLNGLADIVVSNPPYIPANAVPRAPEVRDHDPQLALYGGFADGLGLPQAVAEAAARLLRSGGLFVMEHGDEQASAVRAMVAATTFLDARTVASRRAGAQPAFSEIATGTDLANRDRYVTARRRRSADPVQKVKDS